MSWALLSLLLLRSRKEGFSFVVFCLTTLHLQLPRYPRFHSVQTPHDNPLMISNIGRRDLKICNAKKFFFSKKKSQEESGLHWRHLQNNHLPTLVQSHHKLKLKTRLKFKLVHQFYKLLYLLYFLNLIHWILLSIMKHDIKASNVMGNEIIDNNISYIQR